ncbi:hypothetical protein BDV25DRAFT_147071 [Aspergillus avenaceus]|uniref:Aminoglycoside phosphotransferase domain-containing protein n=1 Tax=Aspergillus avenaceus TaxID=36643 RepID=A0A5N6U888_ASPAV|nr:hypothetical protein BDV25DRAFT_147071 [Aspergillus avenaceus]
MNNLSIYPSTTRFFNATTPVLSSICSPGHGGRLVAIRNLHVVKYGRLVNENDGYASYALHLVGQELSIPTPRLYAMFQREDELYFVMEYIDSYYSFMAYTFKR